MRPCLAFALLLACALDAASQENPLAPGGKPLPRTGEEPAASPLLGGFIDPERELMLVLWSVSEGALEGELALPRQALPVKGKVEGDVFSGTFTKGEHAFPLTLRVEGEAFLLESGGVSYRLARVFSAARVAEMKAGRGGARQLGNEAAAIGALKTICTAQALFREGDKENDQQFDYGTLAELTESQLLDRVLGSGTKQGYKFEVKVGDPAEFLWAATASPVEPGKTGTRWFVIDQAGVIFYSAKGPFTLSDKCEIPKDATPVGK